MTFFETQVPLRIAEAFFATEAPFVLACGVRHGLCEVAYQCPGLPGTLLVTGAGLMHVQAAGRFLAEEQFPQRLLPRIPREANAIELLPLPPVTDFGAAFDAHHKAHAHLL